MEKNSLNSEYDLIIRWTEVRKFIKVLNELIHLADVLLSTYNVLGTCLVTGKQQWANPRIWI